MTSASSRTDPAKAPKPRKLSYRELQELEKLPATIERLESEQAEIHARMADPQFFRRPGGEIAAVQARLAALVEETRVAYARWESLEGD
ncbi:MAG: hypothetical protein R3B90_14290 [Planctomycetaceae bacterium]